MELFSQLMFDSLFRFSSLNHPIASQRGRSPQLQGSLHASVIVFLTPIGSREDGFDPASLHVTTRRLTDLYP
jgi:hypothetical protein